jgi:hypothetical protein
MRARRRDSGSFAGFAGLAQALELVVGAASVAVVVVVLSTAVRGAAKDGEELN